MTAFEIDTALADIAIKKCYICEEKIKQLFKESLTEKKALQIQLGMYSLFLRAALLLYAYNGDREKRFENRKKLFEVTCSKCGCQTKVPFKPIEGKEVYCKDCYAAMKQV